MNKALCISATLALALSGAAFAGGASHKGSAQGDSAASAQQYTESDCQTLSVEAARASCMSSINAQSGASSNIGTGATSDSGAGTVKGTGRMKRSHKPSTSEAAAAQHAAGVAESSDEAK